MGGISSQGSRFHQRDLFNAGRFTVPFIDCFSIACPQFTPGAHAFKTNFHQLSLIVSLAEYTSPLCL